MPTRPAKNLTKAQKKLLDEWFELEGDVVTMSFDVGYCDEFPIDLYRKLENLRDSETLYHMVNQYIRDKVYERIAND